MKRHGSLDRSDDAAIERAFRRVHGLATTSGLPGIEAGTSYGTPALKVGGKALLRIKDAQTLVLMCALEEKELLMAAAPDIYYETDHYTGWPAVLVRLSQIDDAELSHRIAQAWRTKAPARVVAGFEAAGNIPRKAAARPEQRQRLHKKR